MSRFAKVYITHTRGLNQWIHSAAVRRSFVTPSNRRICTYSCVRTYCNSFVPSQSVPAGIRITGRMTP